MNSWGMVLMMLVKQKNIYKIDAIAFNIIVEHETFWLVFVFPLHTQHMVFQKHCTLFLERMRHSSSFEMVQKVKTFVNQFYGTQGSAEEYSHVIRDFVEVTL